MNSTTKIEDIPIPFRHDTGHTVTAIEYPEDRPNVVDLVFDDGLRMAETKGALYTQNASGTWTYPAFAGSVSTIADEEMDEKCEKIDALIERIQSSVFEKIKQAIEQGIIEDEQDFDFFLEDFEDINYDRVRHLFPQEKKVPSA